MGRASVCWASHSGRPASACASSAASAAYSAALTLVSAAPCGAQRLRRTRYAAVVKG